MRSIPLAQYLNRLERESSSELASPRPFRRTGVEGDATKPRLVASNPEADLEDRIAKARQLGFEEGRQTALSEQSEHREKQDLRDRLLEAERDERRAKEAMELAEAISQGLLKIEENVAGVVSRILEPYLMAGHTRRVVDELCKNIQTLWSADAPPLLEISGPEHILDRLREKLAGLPVELNYRLNEDVEAKVVAQDTVIETQLGPWIDVLSSTML